jgi:hypothetical protein
MATQLRSVACLLAVALLDTTAIAAQSPQLELPIGRRVLIQRDRGTDVIGNLVAARADSLFVELEPLGAVRGVPLPRVRGIWVSQGVPQPMMLHGAVGGAIIGGVLVGVMTSFRRDLKGRVVGGVGLGAFVGAILANDVRREPWRRIR